jgi:hypothetical protein
MVTLNVGYDLFSWYVPCGMFPTEYLNWLSQLDETEDSDY